MALQDYMQLLLKGKIVCDQVIKNGVMMCIQKLVKVAEKNSFLQ